MVYLRMFHGRNKPNQEMQDWGFDGPTIGPCEYFHTTYGSDIKFAINGKDEMLTIIDGCLHYQGKYYGDWSITSFP